VFHSCRRQTRLHNTASKYERPRKTIRHRGANRKRYAVVLYAFIAQKLQCAACNKLHVKPRHYIKINVKQYTVCTLKSEAVCNK